MTLEDLESRFAQPLSRKQRAELLEEALQIARRLLEVIDTISAELDKNAAHKRAAMVPAPTGPRVLLNIEETCRRFQLRASFLQRDRRKEKPTIPFVRVGAAIRYDPEEVKRALGHA